MPMSAAPSAARQVGTTSAAHMTGSVSTTTAMSAAATTMHFSKGGGRKSQCQSRDVKNCSHDWFTSVTQIDGEAKTFRVKKIIVDQLVVIFRTRWFYELTTDLRQRHTWE
jgi:hypothetical protein